MSRTPTTPRVSHASNATLVEGRQTRRQLRTSTRLRDTSGTVPAATTRKRVARLATLRLVRESTFIASVDRAAGPVPIRSPRDVFTLMAPYAAREVGESFWILALDGQHRVSAPTVITRGILNASLVHVREVFLAAICASAAGIVLVHNHPSGDPTPSPEDRAVTDQMVAAGRLLDIPIHDHVIVGAGCFVSFAEAGILCEP